MFKVGNLVQIKSFPEIEKADRKRGLCLPGLETRCYCSEWGKITEVKKIKEGLFSIRLNISKDLWWYSCELNSPKVEYTNFILLHACLS